MLLVRHGLYMYVNYTNLLPFSPLQGPVFGFTLMNVGGFQLPFFTIGAMGIVFAVFLVVAIPDVKKVLYTTLSSTPCTSIKKL